jgi:diguanylate cyclase (GGDEF)-like protein
VLAAAAAILAVVSASGLLPAAAARTGALGAAVTFGIAGACLAAGTGRLPRGALRPIWTIGFVVLGATIALAGPASTSLLDVLAGTGLLSFLIFEPRVAIPFLLASQVAYSALAVAYPPGSGIPRAVLTSVVVTILASLIARLRNVTASFARTNRALSERDALTGLANTRALRLAIDQLLENATPAHRRPYLIAFDLDDFKSTNEDYGHSTGDRVLVAVSRAVGDALSEHDLVARRGGDEFVVVIDGCTQDAALTIVARIKEAVAFARAQVCPDRTGRASVASVAWQPGMTTTAWLNSADHAMHAEKLKAHDARRSAGRVRSSPAVRAPQLAPR